MSNTFMTTKRIILFVVIAACLVLAAWAYHLYRQPRAGVEGQKAVATLSAADLYQAYAADEQKANSLYLGKIITVSGVVQEVQQPQAGQQVVLLQTGAPGAINCSMQTGASPKIQPGMTLQVKGKCTGFLMDVNLVDAIVEH